MFTSQGYKSIHSQNFKNFLEKLFDNSPYYRYLCTMKEIKKLLRLNSYGYYKVHIIISENLSESAKKHLNEEHVPELCDGFVTHNCEMELYIFLKDDCILSTISHESFHATLKIMKDIGAKLTNSSEESYAYLLSHVVDECIILKDKYMSKYKS